MKLFHLCINYVNMSKSKVPDNYKKDPYELVLYAIPKYKFRLFFVTYDRDLDVIHYLKYEKRRIGFNLKIVVFLLLIDALLH